MDFVTLYLSLDEQFSKTFNANFRQIRWTIVWYLPEMKVEIGRFPVSTMHGKVGVVRLEHKIKMAVFWVI